MTIKRALALLAATASLAMTGVVYTAPPATAQPHSAVASVAVQAHTASTYVTEKWPVGYRDVPYAVAAGFPGNDFRDAIFAGKHEWNKIATTTSEPEYFWSLADDLNYGNWETPCNLVSPMYSTIVFWGDLDIYSTTHMGGTLRCSPSTAITRASLIIDSDRAWYAGTGDAPSNLPDLWSVAAHEWGHVSGWSPHFTAGEAGVCPSPIETVVRNTMCPTIASGTEVQRSLATHDTHTLQAAY